MWYMILTQDTDDALAKRLANRDAHLARLHQLQALGRLLLAGPRPAIDAEDPGAAGFLGSLIVAQFDDIVAAKEWADADPYVTAGVTAAITVTPFRKVLP
jgi:uncharacterized protein